MAITKKSASRSKPRFPWKIDLQKTILFLIIFALLAIIVFLLISRASGLSQDLSVEPLPASVLFPDQTPTPLPLSNELLPPAESCLRAGCSGQLCVDASFGLEEMPLTTCEWQPQFACYQQAICEVQTDGRCGFTSTTELSNCLLQVQNQNINY